MASGYVVGVASETKAFEQGVKSGIIEPLEDARDRLDDLGKSRGPEEVERDLRDAQKATAKLGDEVKDTARDIEQRSRSAFRAMKQSSDEATHGVKEGLRETADEARSSGREGAASFTGEWEDVGDFVQEVAANAFSGFGPAGEAAGLAAAIGLGFIFTELQKAGDRAELTREQVAGIVDQLFEAQGNPALLDYVAQLREYLDKPAAGDDLVSQLNNFFEQQGTNFDQAQRDAQEYKVELVDLLRAYSGGDAKAALRVIEELEAAQQRLYEKRDKSASVSVRRDYELDAEAIQKVIDRIRDQNALTDEAVSQYEAISEATNQMAAEQEAAARQVEAVEEAVGSLQGMIDSAVSGYAAFKDAESGALDPKAYIDSIGARIAATDNFNANVQSLANQFGLTADETQAILDQGLDFAPMLQSIIDSGLGDEFVAQIQAAVGGGQDVLDGNPMKATVEADAAPADEIFRRTTEEEREAKPIKADADTSKADRALDEVANKSRVARIRAEADTAAAERALDRLTDRRTATIVARVVDRNGVEVP